MESWFSSNFGGLNPSFGGLGELWTTWLWKGWIFCDPKIIILLVNWTVFRSHMHLKVILLCYLTGYLRQVWLYFAAELLLCFVNSSHIAAYLLFQTTSDVLWECACGTSTATVHAAKLRNLLHNNALQIQGLGNLHKMWPTSRNQQHAPLRLSPNCWRRFVVSTVLSAVS